MPQRMCLTGIYSFISFYALLFYFLLFILSFPHPSFSDVVFPLFFCLCRSFVSVVFSVFPCCFMIRVAKFERLPGVKKLKIKYFELEYCSWGFWKTWELWEHFWVLPILIPDPCFGVCLFNSGWLSFC